MILSGLIRKHFLRFISHEVNRLTLFNTSDSTSWEESRKEILDSIHYAKRIQKAHLPTEKQIEKNLNRLQNKV